MADNSPTEGSEVNINMRYHRNPWPPRAWVLSLLLLSFCIAGPVWAGIPDPSNSECDTCLVVSPDGGYLYRITLRDDANVPVDGASVIVDFSNIPGINLCTESDPDMDRRVVGMTDALGVVEFYIRGGGMDATWVTITSQLQTICLAHARSPDLDGSLTIDGTDQSIHQGLAANALAGDYNCDGVTDGADLVQLQARFNNNCSTVAIENRTWGKVKSMYR